MARFSVNYLLATGKPLVPVVVVSVVRLQSVPYAAVIGQSEGRKSDNVWNVNFESIAILQYIAELCLVAFFRKWETKR